MNELSASVYEQLVDILGSRFHVSKEKIVQKGPETSPIADLGFSGIDLIYFLLEVEKHFHVKFELQDVIHYEFMHLSSVVQTVLSVSA